MHRMNEILTNIALELRGFLGPSSRLWVGYLASSVVIALIFANKADVKKLFCRSLYLSSSARIDYMFTGLGFLVKGLIAYPKTLLINGFAAVVSVLLILILGESSPSKNHLHFIIFLFYIFYGMIYADGLFILLSIKYQLFGNFTKFTIAQTV